MGARLEWKTDLYLSRKADRWMAYTYSAWFLLSLFLYRDIEHHTYWGIDILKSIHIDIHIMEVWSYCVWNAGLPYSWSSLHLPPSPSLRLLEGLGPLPSPSSSPWLWHMLSMKLNSSPCALTVYAQMEVATGLLYVLLFPHHSWRCGSPSDITGVHDLGKLPFHVIPSAWCTSPCLGFPYFRTSFAKGRLLLMPSTMQARRCQILPRRFWAYPTDCVHTGKTYH